MKKRLFVISLALIFMFSLAACQKRKPIETDSNYKAESIEKNTEKESKTVVHKFAIALENYDEKESTPIIFCSDHDTNLEEKQRIYESPKPVKISKSEDGKFTILDFEITIPRTHKRPGILVPPVNKHNEPKTYIIQLDITDNKTTTLDSTSWSKAIDVEDIINQTKIAFENGCNSLSEKEKNEIIQKQYDYLKDVK